MFSWSLIKSNTTLEYHKWKTVMGNIHFFHLLKMVLTNAKKKVNVIFGWDCMDMFADQVVTQWTLNSCDIITQRELN